MLTQLDGLPIWIEADDISVLRPRVGTICAEGAKTVVGVGEKFVCVKESVEEIRKLMGVDSENKR